MGISPKKLDKDENQLILRVVSTWGHIHTAGLTEVHLFGDDGKKIDYDPQQMFVKGTNFGAQNTLSRLCNGQSNTTLQHNMWSAHMPDSPDCLQIGIRY